MQSLRIKRTKHAILSVVSICSLLLLSACGGGGGESSPAAPTNSATSATASNTNTASSSSQNSSSQNSSSQNNQANNNATNNSSTTPVPNAPTDYHSQAVYAARFLNQATFGATLDDIEALAGNDVEAWIDEQVTIPMSSHLEYLEVIEPTTPEMEIWRNHRMNAWFNINVYGEDQLRQKMAYALSQIFVISDKSAFDNNHKQIANYYDMLANNAFGNFRQLLEDVTLSPLMGMYLSMRGNEKPDPARNIRPDENYAREVMQLFTIGLTELHNNGEPRLDAVGNTIPTYNQATIEAYAHVFTGWNFNGTTEQSWYRYWQNYNTFEPMTAVEAYHDKGEKRLLNGIMVPANQSAEQDLAMALDSLFMHPNVGPFIGKRLIQFFVTSNPSSAYVERVANAFNNNGSGERGDMLATIKAVLLDPEARADYAQQVSYFGKVKEPILRGIQFMRAMQAYTPSGVIEYGYPDWMFNQAPLSSPSVFNFFLPTHAPQGELAQNGLVAPEMTILTQNYIVRNTNFMAWTGLWGHYTDDEENPTELIVSLEREAEMLYDLDALIAHLDLILLAGNMPDEFSPILKEHLARNSWLNPTQMVAELVFLIGASPQFAIQQ